VQRGRWDGQCVTPSAAKGAIQSMVPFTGHCLEALAVVHSLHGKPDSVFPIMARAETLLRATNAHASLARLYSRRSDELQARGRLGEAKVALGQVLGVPALFSG
jgi:hypothetical protein